MSKFDRRKVRRIIAASAATLLIASLPLASAQAAPKTVDPTGNWKLTGLQIGNAPIVPCPTPPLHSLSAGTARQTQCLI